MIDWTPIVNALFDWVLSQFDTLDAEQIQWKNQNLPRPAYPYIIMHRDSVIREGGPDEVRSETDLDQDQGQEIALITTGPRVFTLNIQAYVDEEHGGGDESCDAMFMITKLQGALSNEATKELFYAAGIAVVEEMPALDLSQVVNAKMTSRATIDIKLRVTSTSTERTGYIDSAEVSSNDDCSTDALTGVSFTT